MQFAQRLQALQSNVFADMDRTKTQAKLTGKTIIDLSLGSSDLPTNKTILDEIARSLNDPSTYGYLLHNGTQTFREAVAQWYSERYGIAVDPNTGQWFSLIKGRKDYWAKD
jgi:aspartate/methionine/tyrosine aminotransferase